MDNKNFWGKQMTLLLQSRKRTTLISHSIFSDYSRRQSGKSHMCRIWNANEWVELTSSRVAITRRLKQNFSKKSNSWMCICIYLYQTNQVWKWRGNCPPPLIALQLQKCHLNWKVYQFFFRCFKKISVTSRIWFIV